MKARIRATGEIAEFSTVKNLQGETILLKVGTASIFSLSEVEPIPDIDWQQVRIDAAIAAMQAELSNPNNTFMMCEDKDAIIAKRSVRRADALVAELKRSDDVYAECRRMDAINTASVCENMTKIQKELQKKGGNNGKSD